MSLAVVAFLISQRGRDPLVDAIRKRLETAEAVAMSKFNSGAPIEDRTREREVIFAAVRMAVKMHVDADLAVSVFSAQIDASKVAQRAFLQKWKGRAKFHHVPDLAKQVRPQLDRLTPIILEGLRTARFRSEHQLRMGPSDPVYREAWIVATRPFRAPKPIKWSF